MENLFIIKVSLRDFNTTELNLPSNKFRKVIRSEEGRLFAFGSFLDNVDEGFIFNQLTQGATNDIYKNLNGDFVILFINEKKKYIQFVNDKNGKYRCYYSVNNNEACFTNHFFSHIKHSGKNTLSNRGINQILHSNYLFDPDTLLEDIHVIPLGCLAEINSSNDKIVRYFDPIDFNAELCKTEKECVDVLDASLKRVFLNRYSKNNPIVFLSGGIDSLIMMHYLRESNSEKLKSLTFAVKDVPNDDFIAAKKASKYYKSDHLEIQIDPSESWTNFINALKCSNAFTYSNIINGALNKSLKENNIVNETLITGQDTRLPSPGFDAGIFLGLKKNITNAKVTVSEKMAWQAAHSLKWWKGRGKGMIDSFIKKGSKYKNADEYFDLLLKGAVHFSSEKGKEFKREDFFKTNLAKINYQNNLNIFKSIVSHFFLGQCTDNMNEYVNYLEGNGYRVDYPFVDEDFVKASNKMPLEISSKPIYTFKTGSAIPVARKFLLRKLIENKIPEKLLWRRKATPFTASLLFNKTFLDKAKNIISKYSNNLLNNSNINQENLNTLRGSISKVKTINIESKVELATGVSVIKLLYLIVINEIISGDDNFLNKIEHV